MVPRVLDIPDISLGDIVIVVLGVTGSGKSTFINYLSDIELEVGHGLETCTDTVQCVPCTLDDGQRIWLLDTPGFDDTYRSDTEILKEVENWLNTSGIRLTGIIYLQSISDVRFTGRGLRNLRIFKRLLGENGLANVVLATTMWTYISDEEGRRREAEIKEMGEPWQHMIKQGSKIFRQDDGRRSALAIVKYLMRTGIYACEEVQTEALAANMKLKERTANQEVQRKIDMLTAETKLKETSATTDHQREIKELVANMKLKERLATPDAQREVVDKKKKQRIKRRDRDTAPPSQNKFQLFDDDLEDPTRTSKNESEPLQKLSDNWFSWLRPLQRLVEDSVDPDSRVKIAILDSGIDLIHQDIHAQNDNIKDVRSWVDGKRGARDRRGGDQCGHGTHVAGLVLKVAPDADVYIAKVTNGTSLQDVDHIAEAIKYAASEWKVDIINLSLGFPKSVYSIESVIRRIDCLIFAAASNGGGNENRAFPATLDQVICMHSTDGRGNPSLFNPNPLDYCDNFCILGEAVESAWPGETPDGNPNLRRKSGTSFATPIATGVAALVLEFARQNIKNNEQLERLRTFGGMKKVLRLMADKRSGSPFRYIAPWTLLSPEDAVGATRDIERALR